MMDEAKKTKYLRIERSNENLNRWGTEVSQLGQRIPSGTWGVVVGGTKLASTSLRPLRQQFPPVAHQFTM